MCFIACNKCVSRTSQCHWFVGVIDHFSSSVTERIQLLVHISRLKPSVEMVDTHPPSNSLVTTFAADVFGLGICSLLVTFWDFTLSKLVYGIQIE